MTATREQAMIALESVVTGAYAWTTAPSRRLKLWSDVQPSERPACFIFEGGDEDISFNNSAIGKQIINPKIFVYIDAKDPNVIGASELNNIMDALVAALAPSGQDAMLGRQSLGGIVNNCRIKGRPFKDPGDLDGDGLLIVPVEIILNA